MDLGDSLYVCSKIFKEQIKTYRTIHGKVAALLSVENYFFISPPKFVYLSHFARNNKRLSVELYLVENHYINKIIKVQMFDKKGCI